MTEDAKTPPRRPSPASPAKPGGTAPLAQSQAAQAKAAPTPEAKKALDDDRRSFTMRAIASPLGKITRTAVRRRGFAEGAILSDWPAIVGPLLARTTCPLKVSFPRGERGDGTLHLRVASSALSTEITHLQPLIIERINAYFGYGAVSRLALTHGPLPERVKAKPPRPAPTAERKQAVAEVLQEITDPDLKAALERLGLALGRRE